ncbi:MAG: pseudouridine-5'-phosphate glycosidase [Pseudomonadota bacterium]
MKKFDVNDVMIIKDDISDALATGKPVVALETAIVTHGMPFPTNLETALAVSEDIRGRGATPAILAIVDGKIRIGLNKTELTALAEPRTDIWKLSRADLAVAVATGATGGTTVAATMRLAAMAGIDVFATGGIGGVHRGAETDFDISADLIELAQTPVTVVASGAKAILDLPKTLEVLETQGVPVIGYQTSEFPAFWSRTSGLAAPLRLDDPKAIASAHAMRRKLGIPGGQLIANPIPVDAEIPLSTIEQYVSDALAKARDADISGKAATPFLLEHIASLSGGDTLVANIALVRNNARVAADIAVALAALSHEKD